jgi:hypothetical protein
VLLLSSLLSLSLLSLLSLSRRWRQVFVFAFVSGLLLGNRSRIEKGKRGIGIVFESVHREKDGEEKNRHGSRSESKSKSESR